MSLLGSNTVERSGGLVTSSSLGTVITPAHTTAPMSMHVNASGQVDAIYETWNAGVTYLNNDFAVGSDSLLYQSIASGNLNHDPTADAGVHWLAISVPNIGTVNGQVPIWNVTSGRFEPGAIPTGSGLPVGTDKQMILNDGTTPYVAVTVKGDLIVAAHDGTFTVLKSNGNVFPVAAAVKGDLWYASGAATLSALAGNTTATKKFLVQTGTGAVSAAPVWEDQATALGFAFVDEETPTGTIDGTNLVFVLANTPLAGTLKLYSDGVRMKSGVDYTLAVATITFASVNQTPTTSLLADYRK